MRNVSRSDYLNAVEEMETAEKRRLARAESERRRLKQEKERLELAKKEELRLRLEAEEKALEEMRQRDEIIIAPFIAVLNNLAQEIDTQRQVRANYIAQITAERERFEEERRLTRQNRSKQ
jgi:hypothetical protein